MKKIPLTQGKFALVDDDKYEELANYKWSTLKKGKRFYAVRNTPSPQRRLISMHRQIMNAKPGQEIDHKNQNGLDNRIKNIRFCSKAQNQQNGSGWGGSSEYKGVDYRKKKQIWRARIVVNQKSISLGHFNSETDAAKAYDAAAVKYFGEFARTNFERKDSIMGKKDATPTVGAAKPEIKVQTTAIINSLTIGCHADKISFTALSFTAHDNELMSELVKKESPVRMTLELPKPDPKFPPIAVEGLLKSFKIAKTCDAPNMTHIQFSSGQVEKIASHIRAEQELKLTFLQIQGELPFEGDPAEEPE